MKPGPASDFGTSAFDTGGKASEDCPPGSFMARSRCVAVPSGKSITASRNVTRLVRDRCPHLDRLGRAGIPLLTADQLRSPDRHSTPNTNPFDLILHDQRLEVEVLVLDLPAHRAMLPRRSSGSRSSVGGNVSTTTFMFGSTVASSAGDTLPSIVTVWTANQYSPSCDDRNVNVGWSGKVLAARTASGIPDLRRPADAVP